MAEETFEFDFYVTSAVTFQHTKGTKLIKPVCCQQYTEISDNLDKPKYFDKDGLPKEPAIKAITTTLVWGIVNNIEYADAQKFVKKEEHLEFVISELIRILDAEKEIEQCKVEVPSIGNANTASEQQQTDQQKPQNVVEALDSFMPQKAGQQAEDKS